MQALLNVVIGAALCVGVYLAMIASGADREIALSTAILVGTTGGLQTLKSDLLMSKLANARRSSFERRLDDAHDHVICLVREHLHDILPDRQDVAPTEEPEGK